MIERQFPELSRKDAIIWAAKMANQTKNLLDDAIRQHDKLEEQNAGEEKINEILRRVRALAKGEIKYWKLVDIWKAGKKAKLKVSFSGGATSAYMAKRIKDSLSHLFELVFVFCNTADEDEKTLIFVDRCDREFELDVDWLEAVVHEEFGKASTHRIVNFETASRKQEPFIEVVKVYGISNEDFEPCNRELKLNPMKSYMKSIGWLEGDYYTAIGIRKDEKVRLHDTAIAGGILYLLADLWPIDKQDVNDYWEDMPFQLGLEEHQGNCKTCWKKNLKKLFMVYAEEPEAFEWRHEMEVKYGWHGAPYYGVPTEGGETARLVSRPLVDRRRDRASQGGRSKAAHADQGNALARGPPVPNGFRAKRMHIKLRTIQY